MATPAQIRAGLAANLASIADTQISAYMLASPTPPVIQVLPERVEYHGAMQNGLERNRYTVQAFVGFTSDVGAQKKLDKMLEPTGATSVKAAVESDATLAGVVEHLTVTEATGYRVYALEGARGPVLGCEWTVEIFD